MIATMRSAPRTPMSVRTARLRLARTHGLERCALHFCEQYFTLSQSLAHFLRHSNGRPHRSQVRGGKPFLTRATSASLLSAN